MAKTIGLTFDKKTANQNRRNTKRNEEPETSNKDKKDKQENPKE